MRVSLPAPAKTVGDIAAILGIAPVKIGDPKERIEGIATDSREIIRGDLFVAIDGARQSGNSFVGEALSRGAVAILTTRLPPVFAANCTVLCVADVEAALLALAAKRREDAAARVIAVSGSTGKTTVKELIATVLSMRGTVRKSAGNFNSGIGMSLSLLSMEDADHFVLELGINHRGEMERLSRALAPDLAVLTNVGTAHVGHFADARELLLEKMKITAGIKAGGRLLLADTINRCGGNLCGAETFTVGTGELADFRVMRAKNGKDGIVADVCWREGEIRELSWHVPGSIGASCIGLGAAVGVLEGLGPEEIRGGLLAAQKLAPRMRRIEIFGRTVVDDTYNASPEAMVGALETLSYLSGDRPSAAVFGDILELGAHAIALHDAVGECAAHSGISHFFTYGDYSAVLAGGALRGGMPQASVHAFSFGNEKVLARQIIELVPRGGVVLCKASRRTALDRVIKELEKNED